MLASNEYIPNIVYTFIGSIFFIILRTMSILTTVPTPVGSPMIINFDVSPSNAPATKIPKPIPSSRTSLIALASVKNQKFLFFTTWDIPSKGEFFFSLYGTRSLTLSIALVINATYSIAHNANAMIYIVFFE